MRLAAGALGFEANGPAPAALLLIRLARYRALQALHQVIGELRQQY